jgi:general secretion pathway protein G
VPSSLDGAGWSAVQKDMGATLRCVPLLCLAFLLSLPLTGCDFLCKRPSLRAREAVLRTNLRTLRDVIGQYRGDKGRRPETLEALVEAGYLRKVPIDPMTRSNETWMLVHAPAMGEVGERGIADVRSGAAGRGSDGRPYRQW